MKLSKLRKLKKSAPNNTEMRAQVDTSMTGAVNEILMFSAMKKGW